MTIATTNRSGLSEYLEQLSWLEDARKPFKPEYLTLDEQREEERLCEGCRNTRRDCTMGLCFGVQSVLDEKREYLSGANRLLHILVTKGTYRVPIVCGLKEDCVPSGREKVSFMWDSEYGEDFCRHCQLYGKDACPEDVYDEGCARRVTVRAIEHVAAAVNELI